MLDRLQLVARVPKNIVSCSLLDSESRNLLKATLFCVLVFRCSLQQVKFCSTLPINYLDDLVFCFLLPYTIYFITKVFGELVLLSKKFSKRKLLPKTSWPELVTAVLLPLNRIIVFPPIWVTLDQHFLFLSSDFKKNV